MYAAIHLASGPFDLTGLALLDTGSNVGLIDAKVLPKEVLSKIAPSNTTVNGVGGVANTVGTVTGTVRIGQTEFSNVSFQVVKDISDGTQMILGTEIFMHPSVDKYEIDNNNKTITFSLKGTSNDSTQGRLVSTSGFVTKSSLSEFKVTCHSCDEGQSSSDGASQEKRSDESAPKFGGLHEKLAFLKEKLDVPLYHSNKRYVEEFADMLLANMDVFGGEGKLGCFPIPVPIETEGPAVSIRQHQIAERFKDTVDQEIEKMAKAGIIQPCKDPKGWNSPIIVVPKKDGTGRVCANFKHTINKRLLRPDPFPAPAIEEIFNDIDDGNEFFSSLDLDRGYWQLEIRRDGRFKTAFTWNDENWEFVKVPFGYTGAGNAFCRAIGTAFNSVNFDRKSVKAYIDDIAIVGKDFSSFKTSHLSVFKALKKFNLRLKPKKCSFLKEEIPFLGRYVSAKGMRPIPEYVEGIKAIKAPTNLKEARRVQGQLTWVKGFIGTKMGEEVKLTSFSHIMEPILDVCRKSPFKWTPKAQEALDKIKARMMKAPFISFSDPSLPYILITDASDVALGGLLCQKKGEKYHIIGTVSKCFTATERRWSTTEREAFAIVYCVRKFSYFLEKNHFTIFTDHKSLTYMDRKNFNNKKINRWQMELSSYSFVVQYLEGNENVFADWLSRPNGVVPEEEPEDFTPAGRTIQIEGTKMRIYIPSWIEDKMDPDATKLRFKNQSRESLQMCMAAITSKKHPLSHQMDEFTPIADFGAPEFTRLPMALASFLSERKLPDNPTLDKYLDMAERQRADPFVHKLIERLESPETITEAAFRDCFDQKDERLRFFGKIWDQLFVDPSTRLLMVKGKEFNQMFLPKCLRAKYLHSAHDCMGHHGIKRTRDHLRHFTWPGIHEDVKDYVSSCIGCTEVKGNYGQNKPQHGHNLRGSRKNEVLYLDYIYLPRTSSGYRYALTVIDSFTRFVTVYPLRSMRAADTARKLRDYCVEHGTTPSVISTDRGSHFIGKVLQDLLGELGIKHNLHCAWRPQSTGILERTHRTLKNSLTIVSKELKKEWPEVLHRVVMAMNAAPNAATKCSPYFAMRGEHYSLTVPTLPKDPKKMFDPLGFGMSLGAAQRKIHKLVDLCARDADSRSDGRCPIKNLEFLRPGDQVMIKRPLSTKADSKIGWLLGYTVLETMDFAARLKNDDTGASDWVHRAHIKKIVPRPPHLLDDDDEDSSDDEYVADDKVDAKPSDSSELDDSSSGGVKRSATEDDLRRLFAQVQEKTMNRSRTSSRSKSARGQKKREKYVGVKESTPNRELGNSRPKRDRRKPDRLNIGDTRSKVYK